MPNNANKQTTKTNKDRIDIVVEEPPAKIQGPRSKKKRNRGKGRRQVTRGMSELQIGGGVRNYNSIRDPSSYMSTVRQLSALPMSSAGRAAFWAALHPPTAPSDQLGLPDASTTPRNVCRVLTNWNLQWDPSYFDTPPTDVTQYDALVLTPPIPEIAAVVFLRPSGTAVWSNGHVFRRNAMDHKTVDRNTFGGLRSEGFAAIRLTGQSSTFYFSGASVRDEGSVTCAAFIPQLDVRDFTVSNKTASTTPDIVQGVARRTLVTIPADTETLTGTNPKSYIGAARDGLFTISKFTASLLGYPFKDAATEGVITFSGTGTGSTVSEIPQSFLSIVLAEEDVLTSKKFDTASAFKPVAPAVIGFGFVAGEQHAYVSDPSDMTWNIQLFEKIDVQSGFKVKNVVIFDSYVPLNSTRGWNNKSPPTLDMRALEYIVVGHQELPDGFPASANDFMDFLRTIGRGVGKAVSYVSGVVGPILRSIPHPLAQAAGMGAGLLNNLVSERQPGQIPSDFPLD